MKSFEVKIYQLNGTFSSTLLATALMNDFSYTSQINGGQGEASFELDLPFNTTTYAIGNFVRVSAFTDIYPNGKLIYSGMVSSISRKITSGTQTIELKCIGLASVMNFVYFFQGSYIFSKNQDPAQTIKDVIDYFNTQYAGSWLSYSGGGIQNYGTSVNVDFSYSKCWESIKDMKNLTNFFWYIGADGQVIFKPKPVTNTHTLTLEDSVDMITIEENGERIINKHITSYKTSTASPSIDATSQTTYGIRELRESVPEIIDNASAVIYSNNQILLNKDFKKKTMVVVNDNYDIEKIQPGDTLNILNTDYFIENLQIQKISYNPYNIRLELEERNELSVEIFNP